MIIRNSTIYKAQKLVSFGERVYFHVFFVYLHSTNMLLLGDRCDAQPKIRLLELGGSKRSLAVQPWTTLAHKGGIRDGYITRSCRFVGELLTWWTQMCTVCSSIACARYVALQVSC